MTPYPYQTTGSDQLLRTLLSGQKGAMLADEPGVGKTAQACMVANMLAPRSVLIVCPDVAKINWQREVAAWDIWGVTPERINTRASSLPPDIVVNYDIVHRIPALLETKFDLVIADESHMLKNRKSKRSKAVKLIADNARHVLLLTGTPVENRPVELFWQMVILGWMKPGQYMEYAIRHCGYHQRTIYTKRGARVIRDDTGATRIPELRGYLKEKGLVRRTKAEVLPDLPPKTHQVIEFARPHQWRSSLFQTTLETSSPTRVKSQIEHFRTLAHLAKESGDKGRLVDSLAEARRLDGIEKVPQVIEHVKLELESRDKVVVFAFHTAVFDALKDGLAAVGINGATPKKERQDAVDRFQSDPATRVFVGQIKAAGTAITLTAASLVVFAELDWIPGLMSQASDRVHRVGQTDNVQVQYLVFEDSTDAVVARALIEKQRTLNSLFGGDAGAFAPLDPVEIFG